MIVRARGNLETSQERYSRDHDKRVLRILRVHAGHKCFLVNPPGLAHTDANRIDTLPQSKLRSPTSGPHDFIRSTETTATISVNGVHKTVSLDRMALVPHEGASSSDATASTPPELHHNAQSPDAFNSDQGNTSVESSREYQVNAEVFYPTGKCSGPQGSQTATGPRGMQTASHRNQAQGNQELSFEQEFVVDHIGAHRFDPEAAHWL